ncbi:hypothetical protein [Azospirillum sp. sgz301742]
MAKQHRADPPNTGPADPPPFDEESPDLTDLARLSPEEIAFLLGRAPEPSEDQRERWLRTERNARSNAQRTARRHADAAYADHLRTGERDRQRRRRAGAPAAPPEPAAALPEITPREAARRLAAHLRDTDTPQTRQLRGRPDLVQRYVAGFTIYRLLSASGARPTRGALAEALRGHFGLTLTPPQVQKLRDQVEGFVQPGGPWHTE